MRYILAALIIFMVLATGCIANNEETSTVSPNSSSKTFTPPMTKYDVLKEEGERPVVEGPNAFTFAMYRELSAEGGNLFFSPYSVYTALAMAYEGRTGARGRRWERSCTCRETMKRDGWASDT